MVKLLISLLLAACVLSTSPDIPSNATLPYLPKTNSSFKKEEAAEHKKLAIKAAYVRSYAASKGFSSVYCFFADMSLPSGKNRLFIYDLSKDSIMSAGLVAHGSCNTDYLERPWFSNVKGCGCTSIGLYKIGEKYKGGFGTSYKLFGLDSTNSNAYKRAIVFHSYSRVPDHEVYPDVICNSLGCPMTSSPFLNKASVIIDASKKPVLFWIIY